MKTRRNHTRAQNPRKINDRWRWMLQATAASAAAATSSNAAIVQINLVNNRLDNTTGDSLDSNLTGGIVANGTTHPGTFFSAANIIHVTQPDSPAYGVSCHVKVSTHLGADYLKAAAIFKAPASIPDFLDSIGTHKASSQNSPQSETQLVPIKFQDSKFNGGALTNGLLQVHAFNVSKHESTIAVTRLVFDDANPTSALAGVVAGGTNTVIGSTEKGFFARTKNDFNSDGSPDLLFQNVSNGHLAVWLMNGTSILSEKSIGVESNTAWQIVGTGVFNASGFNDLLWQNSSTGAVAVWFMDETTILSKQVIFTQPNTSWKIAGAGDFNGDGKPDLVWQNTSTNAVAIWLMNGTSVLSQTTIGSLPNANWKIVGTGDFNGDGNTDILLQDTSTGAIAVWFMNGTTHVSSAIIGTESNLSWKIVGAGDFNGDGKPDILWQNTSTGAIVVWFMNGTTVLSEKLIATEANTSWQIRNK